jgi:AraC-like DNA-binding protein
LYGSITKKSAALKEERQKQICRHLQRALTEPTPPSLNELCKRLGCTKYVLRVSEPDLCDRVAERHNQYRLRQKAEIGRRAAEVMTQSPPPSTAAVAKKLGVSPQYLRTHFPALAKDIVGQHRASEAAAKERRRKLLFDEVLGIAIVLHKGKDAVFDAVTCNRVGSGLDQTGFYDFQGSIGTMSAPGTGQGTKTATCAGAWRDPGANGHLIQMVVTWRYTDRVCTPKVW